VTYTTCLTFTFVFYNMDLQEDDIPSDFRGEINLSVDRDFKTSTFRSSGALKDALKMIVNSLIAPQLRYCLIQRSFQTRLGALMKLAVSFLCMPRFSTLLGFGLIQSKDEGYEITRRACVVEVLLILLEGEKLMQKQGMLLLIFQYFVAECLMCRLRY
jgi:hypothetical protein